MSRDNPKPADITKNTEATDDVAKEEIAKEVTNEEVATELATKAASEATDTAEINIDPAPEKAPFDAKLFLKTVTARPGVYRMYNQHDDIIYVGKAKNLKNRLSSYFTKNHDSPKTRVLVAQITHVEFTVTDNPLSLIHI